MMQFWIALILTLRLVQPNTMMNLLGHLTGISQQNKVYLAAAPQCPFPDTHLDTDIKTSLFDHVWVQFYNNRDCQYAGNANNLLNSWKTWTTVQAKQVFLGVPSAPEAAENGRFIPADVIKNQVLPSIRRLLPSMEGL